MKKTLALLVLLAPFALHAQVSNPGVIAVPSAPSSCNTLPLKVVANTNNVYGSNGSGGCAAIGGGGGGGTTNTIASGTAALGTSAIASAACATVVTATATGALSTDSIIWNPNASIKAVTGYIPSTSGGLTIAAYPTAGGVNFDVCNWTSAIITPGAVTLNWRIVR